MALPHGAVGWSADCGVSWPYSLFDKKLGLNWIQLFDTLMVILKKIFSVTIFKKNLDDKKNKLANLEAFFEKLIQGLQKSMQNYPSCTELILSIARFDVYGLASFLLWKCWCLTMTLIYMMRQLFSWLALLIFVIPCIKWGHLIFNVSIYLLASLYGPWYEKTCLRCLQTTKPQTSLCVCTVWSGSLLFPYWRVSYLNLIQANFQYSS